jgi:tetratricopeptide (TPR) repeat protein
MLGSTLYAVACGHDGRNKHIVTQTPVLVPPVDRALYEAGLGGMPQPPLAAVRRDIDPNLAEWIETLLSISPSARYKSDADMVKRINKLSKRVGKRPAVNLPRARWLKKLVKFSAIAFAILILVFLYRHSYTLKNSPKNIPTFIVTDAAGLLGKNEYALKTLSAAPIPSAEISYAVGRSLERMGQLDEALLAYKKSQSLDASFSPNIKALARVRTSLGSVYHKRGMQLYRSGEYYLADKQLTKALSYGTISIDGYKALADISERRGNLTRSARFIENVCKIQPSSVYSHYKAARLFLDLGKIDKSFYHAEKVKSLHVKAKSESKISDEDIQRLASDVAAACMRAAKIDLTKTKSVRRIWEKMVWLNRAKSLHNSTAINTRLGLFYERLGDLTTGEQRRSHYNKAIKCFEDAKETGANADAVNNGIARIDKKSK